MGLYIKELVNHLDKLDRNWRRYTVILHDGAKYSQSNATINTLRNYKVPYMLLSPYSYNVAPIGKLYSICFVLTYLWTLLEMLFGAIKTDFMNPDHLPTGKGAFKTIIALVIKKIQTIPKYQRMMFWHHCYQHIFRFLLFQKLWYIEV